MLTTFQLITLDYWEDVYNMVIISSSDTTNIGVGYDAEVKNIWFCLKILFYYLSKYALSVQILNILTDLIFKWVWTDTPDTSYNLDKILANIYN